MFWYYLGSALAGFVALYLALPRIWRMIRAGVFFIDVLPKIANLPEAIAQLKTDHKTLQDQIAALLIAQQNQALAHRNQEKMVADVGKEMRAGLRRVHQRVDAHMDREEAELTQIRDAIVLLGGERAASSRRSPKASPPADGRRRAP